MQNKRYEWWISRMEQMHPFPGWKWLFFSNHVFLFTSFPFNNCWMDLLSVWLSCTYRHQSGSVGPQAKCRRRTINNPWSFCKAFNDVFSSFYRSNKKNVHIKWVLVLWFDFNSFHEALWLLTGCKTNVVTLNEAENFPNMHLTTIIHNLFLFLSPLKLTRNLNNKKVFSSYRKASLSKSRKCCLHEWET